MGPPGPTQDVTIEDTRGFFSHTDRLSTPFFTGEVAEVLECSRQTARRHLENLAERGEIQTKRGDDSRRVWWMDERILSGDHQPSEAQFRAFVSAVNDYAIFMLDPDGRIVSWNRGAERIKGYSKDEIVGEHFSRFYTDDDVADGAPERNLETAVAEGRVEDEGWRVRKDGSRFWANVTITAIRDGEGALQGFTKVTRDMTERREYEQQLEEQAERLERQRDEFERELDDIFDRVDEAFLTLDTDWHITYVNDRTTELVRLPAEELVGSRVWDALPEIAEGRPRELAEAAMRRQESVEFEFYSELLDIWVEVRGYPSESGMSVYFRDISERKARERELKRVRERMEFALTATDAVVWDWNVDDDQASFYPSAESLYGRSVETWEDFIEVVHPEDRQKVQAGIEHTLETGEPKHEEIRIVRDGDVRWIEAPGHPVQDDDGSTRMVGVARDITERKTYERALEDSERRHRTLVEHFPDGAVGMFDDDLRYTAVGGQLLDQVGLTPEDRIGKNISEVYPEEIVETYGHYFQAVFEGEANTFEAEFHDRHLYNQTLPVRDADGDVYAGMLVAQDITERKERERELEQYETIIESLDEGVYVVDAERNFQWVNEAYAEMLGYSREELIGENASMVVADEEVIREAEVIEETRGYGNVPRMDVELVTRSGGRVPVDAAATLLPEGKEDGWLRAGVVRDISEQVEYQNRLEELVDELEESNERLEQFAYIASHDLQEPLRMVSSYLQLLEDRYRNELDGDAREFIDFAVDGAERMRTMVDALLAYSRLDTDAESLEPTDSENLVDHVLDQLQLQIEENDAEVIVGELPTVDADGNQLEQVFQNLISNAIKYRDDDPPRIEISAEQQGDTCQFRVADNGIGIDPAYTDQIFEVFKRLHSHKDYPGTGIGLALCKKIVDRHGGEIWVESEPGEGSTFYFTIPLAA